jgi:hypothetical protein
MPCLFALMGAFAPRLTVLFLWLFTPLVSQVFTFWLVPLLGILFLPFTILMYVLVAAPLGSTNFWGWVAVVLGFLIDLRPYMDAYTNRNRLPGYSPSYTN